MCSECLTIARTHTHTRAHDTIFSSVDANIVLARRDTRSCDQYLQKQDFCSHFVYSSADDNTAAAAALTSVECVTEQ